jgi:hypothetical protein
MSKRLWEPPEFEWTQLGAVPVEMTELLKDDDGARLAGCAEMYGRKIVLDSELPLQSTRVILNHEWGHLVLHDAGITLPADVEEAVVQAYGTAMVAREDFHAERTKRKVSIPRQRGGR